jgi:hypothetical protein
VEATAQHHPRQDPLRRRAGHGHLERLGYDDKVVAKRLGISLRTFQRHLADIMRRIGARNRLHAGYLLRDLGIFHAKVAEQQKR